MNSVHDTDPNVIETFSKKYTKASGISQRLINHFFSTLETLVRRVRPGSITEVGCGPGFSTAVLARCAPIGTLRACDIEPELVNFTQSRVVDAVVQVEDAHRLSYETHSTDLVVCLEVLEHVQDPQQVLKELARITRNYAIVSVPREPIWRCLNLLRGAYVRQFGNTPGHINHWSGRAFSSFVSDSFDIVESKFPLPWTMLLLKKKL